MVTVSSTSSTNAMAVSFDSQSVASPIGSASWMPSKWVSRSRQISSAGVQRGDDVEEEGRAAFHRLQHQVGDRPDVHLAHAPGELSVVDREHDQQADDRPERDLVHDRADAQARERQVLRERRACAENLVHPRQARRPPASAWAALPAAPAGAPWPRALPCDRAVSASTDIGKSAHVVDERERPRSPTTAGGCRGTRPASCR